MKLVIGVERHGVIACFQYEFPAGMMTFVMFSRLTPTTWKMTVSDHLKLIGRTLHTQRADGSLERWDGVQYAFPRPDTGTVLEDVDSTPFLCTAEGFHERKVMAISDIVVCRLGHTFLCLSCPIALFL